MVGWRRARFMYHSGRGIKCGLSTNAHMRRTMHLRCHIHNRDTAFVTLHWVLCALELVYSSVIAKPSLSITKWRCIRQARTGNPASPPTRALKQISRRVSKCQRELRCTDWLDTVITWWWASTIQMGRMPEPDTVQSEWYKKTKRTAIYKPTGYSNLRLCPIRSLG